MNFMNDLGHREERSDRKHRLRDTVKRYNKITYKKEPKELAEYFNEHCYDKKELKAMREAEEETFNAQAQVHSVVQDLQRQEDHIAFVKRRQLSPRW